MILLCYKVKRILDPLRADILHQWLKNQAITPSFISLHELKTQGKELEEILKKISSRHEWHSSFHPTGSEGYSLGNHKDLIGFVTKIHKEKCHR